MPFTGGSPMQFKFTHFRFEDLGKKSIAALLAFLLCGAPQLLSAQSGAETQQAPAQPQTAPQNPAQSAPDAGAAPAETAPSDQQTAQPEAAPANGTPPQQSPAASQTT